MSVIMAGTVPSGNLTGKDHDATISLILDASEPGQGPRVVNVRITITRLSAMT